MHWIIPLYGSYKYACRWQINKKLGEVLEWDHYPKLDRDMCATRVRPTRVSSSGSIFSFPRVGPPLPILSWFSDYGMHLEDLPLFLSLSNLSLGFRLFHTTPCALPLKLLGWRPFYRTHNPIRLYRVIQLHYPYHLCGSMNGSHMATYYSVVDNLINPLCIQLV